jgi:CubicO group peptidase (beta-lactamase class C family)
MAKFRKIFAHAICGLALAVQALHAQQVGGYDFTRARAVIDSVMKADAIPSIAVAVAKGDRILWETGVGFANVERQLQATANTPYSLASISKPFTATGIMVLAQQGLVRLRSPVNHYLGGARVVAREGSADGVTLQQLLTHTAGLPLHYQFFYTDGEARPPMDSTIRRYAVAVYPPGAAYQYSNLGYGLLDYVISRKSGMTYEEFMRRQVFAPLGLTSTSIGPPRTGAAVFAERYDADNKPIPYYTFDHPGASEVYSSAHDLARFGLYHLGARLSGQRQILARETVQDMQRDVARESPEATRGLGWGIRTVNGVRRVSHSGGMPGVSTVLALYPEDQVVIAVLLNKSVPGATTAVLNELSATMLPRFASGLRAARARGTPPPAPKPDLAPLQGEWRGFVYSYADSVPVTLTSVADTLRVSLAGAAPLLLDDPVFDRGVLTGSAQFQLQARDLARYAHRTTFWLRVHDETMSGYAAAQTTTRRAYYALSSYIRLERVTK